jgi:tetratricopeptide (TPR) repeat protein
LLQYGSLMEALGQLEQGLRFKQQALERDSRSPLVFVHIAMSYWHQRRYDDAMTWATRALDLDPQHLLAGEFLAGAYWQKGDLERFLAENLRRAKVWGVPEAALAQLQRSCAEMKDAYVTGGHRKLTRYMLEQVPRGEGGAASIQLAVLHGAVGDFDIAFEHLDQALDARDPALVYLAVAPQWDNLRADVRLNQRLTRMGLDAARSFA